MKNALYDFHSLVDMYQKTQLVDKNRTLVFSMKQSLLMLMFHVDVINIEKH